MKNSFKKITDDLLRELRNQRFGPPVEYVYNPLEYARKPYDEYLKRYGRGPKEVILVGMNPGPWGMAQTGVPFGEVIAVVKWLGIDVRVGRPSYVHPKRPVEGADCGRSEVSGLRLWGWARDVFGTPEQFFRRFFVANYCPLMFLEKSGRNRTPDKLKAAERKLLFSACNRALKRTVERFAPVIVIGIGRFAEERCREALAGMEVQVGMITHPSPANPRANRGWIGVITEEFARMGVSLR